jgi:hypothetical protein
LFAAERREALALLIPTFRLSDTSEDPRRKIVEKL